MQAVRPQTICEMEEAIREEWESLPHETVQDIIASMPARVQAVIDAEGGHTSY